jgi:hypothetical protein
VSGEYLTMREIGWLFGVSSHVIGRTLKKVGLRFEDGKPTRLAFVGSYCEQRWTQDHGNYCWIWSKDKTISILEKSGLQRTSP